MWAFFLILFNIGHVPGRPQGGRHGMVFGQIPITITTGNLSTPLVPGRAPFFFHCENISYIFPYYFFFTIEFSLKILLYKSDSSLFIVVVYIKWLFACFVNDISACHYSNRLWFKRITNLALYLIVLIVENFYYVNKITSPTITRKRQDYTYLQSFWPDRLDPKWKLK